MRESERRKEGDTEFIVLWDFLCVCWGRREERGLEGETAVATVTQVYSRLFKVEGRGWRQTG